jgi:hypothetical protein
VTAYCTVDQVKESGRLNILSDDDDATLDSFVGGVSEWIDVYCRRPTSAFAVASNTTRYYCPDDCDGQVLRLDDTLLTLTTLTNGNSTVLGTSAYRLHPRNQPRYNEIHLLSAYQWSWTDMDSEIAVNGKFGYSLTVPKPVEEATIHYAAWLFKRYQAALQDANVNFELGQIQYGKRIPEGVLAWLEPYIDRSKTL